MKKVKQNSNLQSILLNNPKNRARNGAGEGVRTLDVLLGKQALYR